MLNLDKNKTYVLACSFGPDSMALFHMLLESKIDIIVAHVNYHKRQESDFEEQSLKKYCDRHNIKFEVLNVNETNIKGNFQTWARNVRYEFFKTIYEKYQTHALLVAHHEDDVIETYLMQVKRKTDVSFYGIASKTRLFDMNVYRPLLKKTKKELLLYCQKNVVPYAIDQSNNTDAYTRNIIRHEQVEKLNKMQRKEILKDINERNREIKKVSLIIKKYRKNDINLEELLREQKEVILKLLQEMPRKNGIDYSFSKKCSLEMLKAIMTNKANIDLFDNGIFKLIKSYNHLTLIKNLPAYEYHYLIEKTGVLETDKFSLDLNIFEGFIKAEDFPLRVRTLKKSDEVKIGLHKKQVSRLFIEWKLPRYLRSIWPVVESQHGEIVYVPRYLCDLGEKIKLKSGMLGKAKRPQ